MHTQQHTVYLSDTDVTGQVYYARPLDWLEWCRVDWFTAHFGNFMRVVEDTGITCFPAKVAVEYKRPMFFGDSLTIEMRAKDIKKVGFVFEYTIRRVEEVVLTSEITMVCFNTRQKRLAPIPPDWITHLEQLV